MIQACGFFFGHGSGNYISRSIGAKKYKSAERMASAGFFSAVILGTICAIIGFTFRVQLARVLGATDTILPDTLAYMDYILLGLPFIMSSFVLNNQLRLQGNAFFAMAGLVSGAVCNSLLDPVLIFGFHMGVAGAGLSTMISEALSFLILLAGCQRSDNITIRWSNFKPTLRTYREIAAGGLPSLCRQGISSLAILALNHLAGGYGDAAIAGFAVVNKIVNLSGAAIIGFGQGFQPVCGFNYGAGLYKRVSSAFWFGVKLSTVVLIVLAGLIALFAPQLIGLFSGDSQVIAVASAALRFQCLTMPLQGWIVMTNMFLQNIRETVKASILALSRQGLMYIPMLFLLSGILGLTGLEITQPLADLLTFMISIPFGMSVLNRMKHSPDCIDCQSDKNK
ncbi:MAG: MATE family efflux transporter, partial [Eubacteriaceae bacterium]|jgi:putative MATE family efflux protein